MAKVVEENDRWTETEPDAVVVPLRDPPPKRELRTFSAINFDGVPVPEREFLVDQLVPVSTVTGLSGDGGTGKSQIGLQLGVVVAVETLRTWCSQPVRKHGPVYYLSAEDEVGELHRRVVSICNGAGIGLDRLADLHIEPLAGEDALLAIAERPGAPLKTSPLFAAIEQRISELRPRLVVLDTLADLFGGDENNRQQARQFVGLLRHWAIEYQMAVLLLSQPSLSGLASGSGTSGSTAWNNSLRSRLYLERVTTTEGGRVFEPDPDQRVLKLMKANYGRVGLEVPLRWVAGTFEPVDTPVIDNSAHGIAASQARIDDLFLSLLAEFRAHGRNVSAVASPTYAPAMFAKVPRAIGTKKRAFEDAMNRLFAAGKITMGKSDGAPSRQKDVIVLSEVA